MNVHFREMSPCVLHTFYKIKPSADIFHLFHFTFDLMVRIVRRHKSMPNNNILQCYRLWSIWRIHVICQFSVDGPVFVLASTIIEPHHVIFAVSEFKGVHRFQQSRSYIFIVRHLLSRAKQPPVTCSHSSVPSLAKPMFNSLVC